ncbi:GGDEF domain-containing response regulator [Beggiatoa leptomitoformis]|nr:GGDEF domain-containing response regulator [Beggiatoa leptomitoformis]
MNAIQAHILVVDDAQLIRNMMVQVLKKAGYTVDTVENGQQAVDYFIEYHPDLILMDADMPVLNGLEACQRIRELPEGKNIPILIVTAFGEREWVDRAYQMGATDYLTKPVNWHVLRNRIHYILQARRAEEALFEEKERAQVTLASIGDGVITTNAEGKVDYINPVAVRLTGWTPERAYGQALNEVFFVIDETTGEPVEAPLQRCLEQGETVDIAKENNVLLNRQTKQYFAIEDSVAPIRDRKGHIIGVVVVFHDVTELVYKSKHDSLTDLYNRREFESRLKRTLHTKSPIEHSLLYMDLDQFKIVNDLCGHEAGDQLLKDVALLLKKKVKENHGYGRATLARLGGDEFGLLLEKCGLQQSTNIANNIREAIENYRFFWRSNDTQETGIFSIGISIGLVPFNTEHAPQHDVLAVADASCFAAKHAGRNMVHVYQEKYAEQLERHKEIQWVSLINDNLTRENGFSLYYQPIMPLSEPEQGFHYEILLRMDDQRGSLLSPGSFLSAAGRHNLMPILDQWVVKTVLQWFVNNPHYIPQLTLLSINISGHSLGDKNFLATVIDSIRHAPIPPYKLCFEINETSAITNLSGAVNFMSHLKKLGCRFALDNFGAGMSSFSYLKNLPIDFIKIDGDFVKGIVNDPIDYATVKAINDIGHLMHIKTIAERVETKAILDKLKGISVDYVQGYWVGEPQPLKIKESIH